MIISTKLTAHLLDDFLIFDGFFSIGSVCSGVTRAALCRGHVDAAEDRSRIGRKELEAGLARAPIGVRREVELKSGLARGAAASAPGILP
jgi:hypothetical protein